MKNLILFPNSLTQVALATTAAAITLGFSVGEAQAVLLVGNIDNGTLANQGNQVNGADNEFVSFTTPNDGITRIVDDITVQFSQGGFGTTNFNATLIWYNAGLGTLGNPTGAASQINLGTQSVTVTAGVPTNFAFVPSQSLTLLPNTTYGFRINGTSGSGLTWLSRFVVAGDFNSTYQTFPGAQFVRAWRTNDSGTTWTTQTSQRIFEVNFSPVPATVPEPSSVLALVTLGLLGGASALKKQK